MRHDFEFFKLSKQRYNVCNLNIKSKSFNETSHYLFTLYI